METKQTAVDWLIEHIKLDALYEAKTMDEWINVFNHAKAMEKEKIKDAYNFGYLDYTINMNENAEQYYNETYGK